MNTTGTKLEIFSYAPVPGKDILFHIILMTNGLSFWVQCFYIFDGAYIFCGN